MKVEGAILGLALALAGSLAAQQPQQAPQGAAPRATRPMAEMPGMGRMWGGPGQGMQDGMFAPERLVDRRDALGLTPDQVSRLEALAQDVKQAREKAQADAKPHWDQLADLWKQASPDVGQVRAHAQAAMQAVEAAHLAQLTAAAQAKAVLTAEQRGRVAGWADAWRLRMNRMGGAPDMPGRMRMPGRRPWPGRTPRGS